MKYAVIRTGGKQYKVTEGAILDVERVETPENESITFPEVLLVVDEETVSIGVPVVNGMTVTGTVMSSIRGEKIRVSKFKAKARYRRVTGHRQALSRVQIVSIGSVSNKPTSKKAEKPESTQEVNAEVAVETKSVKKASKAPKAV